MSNVKLQRMRQTTAYARGYSMVELSIVFVIVGLLGLLAVRAIQNSRAPTDRMEILQQLAQAQQTVDAFVLRNHRLPCAANAGDGNEACSSAQATALPWRALGLPSSFATMRYGVDRGLGGGADLAVLPAPSISPTLVSAYPDLGQLPVYAEHTPANAAATAAASAAYQASVNTALSLTTLVNGLDWCHGLRQKARGNSGFLVGAGATGIDVAYAIAHPGLDRSFSGSNATPRVAATDVYIDTPARMQSADYDDIVWATGAPELLTRIGCNVRLAQALTTAQEAYAAYDNARLLEQHWLMVDTGVETAQGAVVDAGVGVGMAALGLALGVTASALAIAGAVNTEGMLAFQIVTAALNVAVATAQVAVAAADLAAAIQDLADAKTKLDNTNDYVASVFAQLKAATDRAVLMNQRGLTP
jgi:type II secretory pathway pseudopilin PulG